MKQNFRTFTLKSLLVFLLVFGKLFNINTLFAQSYCYKFEPRIVGTKLEVDIILTASSTFKLGNTYLNFTYNTAALSLNTPIPFTNNLLPLAYLMTINSPSTGVISTSVSYNGSAGAGKSITSGGVKIATLTFNILNPLIVRDFKLLDNGFKNVAVSKDDNLTILALSAQCPPSPYTSLFYDVNIELEALIPMNECVDANTPNSVKINFGDDETREILPDGFKFDFYCEQVTSLRIGTDGALLVNADPSVNLPTTNQGKLKSLQKVIAPWWDEWRKGMGSINCLLKDTIISGAPTRMLIIQWNNLSPVDNITPNNLNTDPLKATFNVVIFENSSIIKFNYKDIDFTRDYSGRPDLTPVVEQKQNGVNGSVGMKGSCNKGEARDGVNNIIYDGPIGISLFDVSTAQVYKAITFYPISAACEVIDDVIDISACQNQSPIQLPLNSAAINGTWTGTGTQYLNSLTSQTATFNPTTPGNYQLMWTTGCNFDYVVNLNVNPLATAFAGIAQSVCAGGTVSLNGTVGGSATTGVWSAPSGNFSNASSFSSTYTPSITSGNVILTLTTTNATAPCAQASSTVVITVVPNTLPIFNIVSTICIGSTAPILPATSDNGITGTWNPSVVSNTATGTYVFTPDGNGCATILSKIITVTPKIIPTFTPIPAICIGGIAPILPTTSNNGIIGTWSPATVDNTTTGTYTFTPTAGLCATSTTLNITVNPLRTVAFNIAPVVCFGGAVPILPTTSPNGITGTWSPAVVDNTASGTYTFTPSAGFCASPINLTITVIFRGSKPIPNPKADTVYCSDLLNCKGRFKDTLRVLNPCADNDALRYYWILRDAQNNILFTNTSQFIDVTLDTGCYTIQWIVINSSSIVSDRQSYQLCIKDCKPPEILTHNKNASLTRSGGFEGEAVICAVQVLNGLRDNCTDSAFLRDHLTMVRDDENPSRQYSPTFNKCIKVSCQDVNMQIPTQVWSIDKAGNPNFTLTYINVQDNLGICSMAVPLTSMTVSTKMETNRPVKNVAVSALLNNTNTAAALGNTDVNGLTTLQNLPLGRSFQVKADKTDEVYAGVTTYDIAVISRHILDIERITSPYALLAGDVNEDGEIDATDILLIRNFILQRIPALPLRSWRFVDSSYIFKNPRNPFAEDVPEIIFIPSLAENTRKAFRAIKKGDVTTVSSVIPTASIFETRNASKLSIQTEDVFLEKGKEYAITLTASDFNALSYQFTLGFTPKGIVTSSGTRQEGVAQVQSIEVNNDLPNLSDGNFGIFKNAITTSWNGNASTKTPQLLTLHFVANQSGQLSEMLSINSSKTPAEAYNLEGRPMPIELKFTNTQAHSEQMTLYQNHPNPFDKETTIAFNLPKETKAKLTIYNAQGQILYTLSDAYKAGYNEILMSQDVLKASGVLYYRLDTPEHSATRKMIVFK